MIAVLLFLLIAPVIAALVALVAPVRASGAVTAIAGGACFAAVIALVPAAGRRDVVLGSYLRADALSVVFLLATSFLYAAVAVYLIGFLRSGGKSRAEIRYSCRLLAGLNVFAWSMLAAPMMSSLALLWVAVEVTTVVSALLVALEGTDGAAEAAWKYVLIASAGLGIALLGTIFAYYAGEQVLGQSYELTFVPLLHAAPHLAATPVRLAFVFAVLGFGTKMGLVPVHTWLPDAHAFVGDVRAEQASLVDFGPRQVEHRRRDVNSCGTRHKGFKKRDNPSGAAGKIKIFDLRCHHLQFVQFVQKQPFLNLPQNTRVASL